MVIRDSEQAELEAEAMSNLLEAGFVGNEQGNGF